MRRIIALSFGLALFAGPALAQQSLTSQTPGVTRGTTGTTFGAPGAPRADNVPGGGIPQSAGTQDPSLPAQGVSPFNNAGSTMPGTSMPGTSMPGVSTPGGTRAKR